MSGSAVTPKSSPQADSTGPCREPCMENTMHPNVSKMSVFVSQGDAGRQGAHPDRRRRLSWAPGPS